MAYDKMLLTAFVVLVLSSLQPVHAGNWTATSQYPMNESGQQCIYYSGYVYCTSGATSTSITNNTYSSAVTGHGLSGWTAQPAYPQIAYGQSCVTALSNLYCIGGFNYTSYITTVYTAMLAQGTIADWRSLEAYPVAVSGLGCAASSNYMVCLGGKESSGSETASAYYTSISGNAILNPQNYSTASPWAETSNYPMDVAGASCQVSNGYLYCVGGSSNAGYLNSTFFSHVSPSGLTAWTATTPYPVAASGTACAIYSGYLVCVGGYNATHYFNDAFAAPISHAGIGAWTQLPNYPEAVSGTGCTAASDGYMFCAGGFNGTAYTNATYSLNITFGGPALTTTAGIVSRNITNIGISSTTVTTVNAGNVTSPASGSIVVNSLYVIAGLAIAACIALYWYSRIRHKKQALN